MATVSDARFDSLRGQGFTGATNDMLLQWLQANGATAKAIPDAWREFLDASGYSTGHRNDDWYALLGGLGYTGNINDRELAFWEAGGVVGGILPVINFTATYVGPGVDLSWGDNPGNDNVATSYTISRAGQPDVPITAPTTTYTDTRDITPGETIVWTITLTTIDGTSRAVSTSDLIPVVAPTVEAGGPYTVTVSAAVQMAATVTPGDDLTPTLLWEIVSGGTGTFSDPAIEDPTFTPDSLGDYVLRLTASDIYGSSVSDTASLTSVALQPPINLTLTVVSNSILELNWEDNPANAKPAASYTISRAGQPDVPITAPTTTYQDTRDLTAGELITWSVTLTNADGTSSAVEISFQIPDILTLFNAPLQSTLIPIRAVGSPTPTYSRASDATFTDFEGIVRTVSDNESRFLGARRVQNLCGSSEDIGGAGWDAPSNLTETFGFTDPLGGSTATRLTTTSETVGNLRFRVQGAEGEVVTSYWLRSAVGDINSLKIYNGSGTSSRRNVTAQLTGSWQRFSGDVVVPAGTNDRCGLELTGVSAGVSIDIAFATYEEVGGQANQAPSEYVSVGVESAPFHGANVDGVQYFTTTNGNTVDANGVVTEAEGTPLTATDYYNDADGPYGYVSEGTSTNEWQFSEELDNAYWQKGSSVSIVSDDTAAPDGALSADLIQSSAVNGTHFIRRAINPVTADVQQTLSVFAKKGTYRYIGLRAYTTGTRPYATFDFDTESFIDFGNSGEIDSASFTELGNGWYRLQVTATPNVTEYRVGGISLVTADGQETFQGDGTENIWSWGLQLEASSFATSYIKTEAATVQRLADALNYDDVGNMQDAAGTAFAQASTFWAISNNYKALSRNSAGSFLYSAATVPDNRIQAFGGNQSISQVGPNMQGGPPVAGAATWSDVSGELIAYYDGGLPDLSPAVYGGTMGTGVIGVGKRNDVTTQNWNGTIRKVQIYDVELDETQVGQLPDLGTQPPAVTYGRWNAASIAFAESVGGGLTVDEYQINTVTDGTSTVITDIGHITGVHYFEIVCKGTTANAMIGLSDGSSHSSFPGSYSGSLSYWSKNGQIRESGANLGGQPTIAQTTTSVYGVIVDIDAATISWFVDGVAGPQDWSLSLIAAEAGGISNLRPAVGNGSSTDTYEYRINTGQEAFDHPENIPDGCHLGWGIDVPVKAAP